MPGITSAPYDKRMANSLTSMDRGYTDLSSPLSQNYRQKNIANGKPLERQPTNVQSYATSSDHDMKKKVSPLSADKNSNSNNKQTGVVGSASSSAVEVVPPAVPKKPKKKKKNSVTANLAGTRYDVIRQSCEKAGFFISKDEDPNCFLIWSDSFVSTDRISDLRAFQKINHFPGMGEICRKDCLARNMIKMAKTCPEEYNFVPRTWILPSEYSQFQAYAKDMKKKKKARTYIVKPSNGAMGNGILLYRSAEKIPSNENMIVQEYLDKPFLVDGYKCDMRIYVLVTSCDPLRFFLYNDGLLRMSTEKYTHPSDQNIECSYMHLTNYSINKHSEQYDKSGTVDSGSKRTLKWFNDYLKKHDYDIQFLWRNITDIIIKTLIVAHPHVLHAYRMCRPGQPPGSDSVCFEILGFDIILDRKLRPWLLEINRSPSFGTDERLDYEIKSGVVEDTLRLLNIRINDRKRALLAQKNMAQRRLIYRKRVDVGADDKNGKTQSVERRKEELKEMLTRIRKDSVREDFENRHSGRFKRIFPPDDKFRRDKYIGQLNDAFKTFLSGRSSSLQKEIEKMYTTNLREEDILDMLAECEADEKDGKLVTSTTLRKTGPKPLIGMPTSRKDERKYRRVTEEEDSDASDEQYEDEDLENEDYGTSKLRSGSLTLKGRPNSASSTQRSRSLSRAGSRISTADQGDEALRLQQQKEREEELTKRTLMALNDMRIKFPGKSDEEAEYILDKLHENWKFHKPRIASYWLVKLDSIKRRKVIDIVRSNVRAMMQRTWKTNDVDSLRMYRIFSRVFNRLLWSHGQGLWNCFQTSGNSWETIFSKSTDTISPIEMASCRRIVQLCRDCLLIVYQFAAEAKSMSTSNLDSETNRSNNRSLQNLSAIHGKYFPRPPSGAKTDRPSYVSTNTVSQKISRLYNRTTSMNNLSTAT